MSNNAQGCRVARFVFVHGPGAEREVRRLVESGGYLLRAEVRPDGGLKAEAARDLASLLDTPPPCDRPCAVVLGPLDDTLPRAGDALLKSTEDLPGGVSVFAWALDVAAVPPALKSRAVTAYAPGPTGPPPEAEAAVRRAMECARREPWEVGKVVEGLEPRDLLLGVAEVACSGDPADLQVWSRARQVLRGARTSRAELLWVLVGA